MILLDLIFSVSPFLSYVSVKYLYCGVTMEKYFHGSMGTDIVFLGFLFFAKIHIVRLVGKLWACMLMLIDVTLFFMHNTI